MFMHNQIIHRYQHHIPDLNITMDEKMGPAPLQGARLHDVDTVDLGEAR